jgi:hypothetical protein
MAKKKSFRSGPRIVTGRDNDRSALLIRLVYAICFSLQDTGVSGAGKKPRQEVRCRDGHSDAEKHPGKHTLRAAFTEGEGEAATTIATRDSPRAIVLENACCRTLKAFSQGDWPLTAQMPLMRDQRRISFGRLSSLPASSFQMMRAGHRIGIQRPWGSSAAARRNFNFRLPTLTVPLNQVRREVT